MGADLLSRPVPEAQLEKWRAGRRKYGGEWAGDPPLVELYAECLDALNYIDEAHTRGDVDTFHYRELRWWCENLLRVNRRALGLNPEA